MGINVKLHFDTWKGNRRFCYHLFWINCLEKGTLVLVAGRYCISLQQLKLSLTMAQDITEHFHCRSLKTCQMYATTQCSVYTENTPLSSAELSAQSAQRALHFGLRSSVLNLYREHSISIYGAQYSVCIRRTLHFHLESSVFSLYREHSTSAHGAHDFKRRWNLSKGD